jgi:hypothetical protein
MAMISLPAHNPARVQAELLRYTATLPRFLQPHLPAAWRDPNQPLELHPYAALTADFFGLSDQATIVEAATAGLLMELHCCLQDARLDGHLAMPALAAECLGNLFFAESLARFNALSQDPAALAPHVHRSFIALAEGYVVEGNEEQDYFRAITNRCAPFHILIAALGLHAGQLERIEPCAQMARHLLFWFQTADDRNDWREDLAAGRRSHLLHHIAPLLGGLPFPQWTTQHVEDALYLYGGAEGMLALGCHHLEAALAIARRHGASPRFLPAWIGEALLRQRQLRQWCLDRKRQVLKSA